MNRKLSALLALLLTAGIVSGCSGGTPSSQPSSGGEESSTVQSGEATPPEEEMDGGAQMVNPMVEFSQPDFSETAGFSVSTLPEGWVLDKCYLIGETTGDLRMTATDGTALTYRMAVDISEDISGVYGVKDPVDRMVGEIAVTTWETPEGYRLASWVQEGYRFSLYVENAIEATAMDALVDTALTQTALHPAQATT